MKIVVNSRITLFRRELFIDSAFEFSSSKYFPSKNPSSLWVGKTDTDTIGLYVSGVIVPRTLTGLHFGALSDSKINDKLFRVNEIHNLCYHITIDHWNIFRKMFLSTYAIVASPLINCVLHHSSGFGSFKGSRVII